MKTVIVYESMYGNTRVIADAIGRGLGPENETAVVPVAQAHPELRRHGCIMAAKPESFLVTKDNHLRSGEQDRAWKWGHELSHHAAVTTAAGRYG